MKILALSGSLRTKSINTGLLRAIKAAASQGVEIDIATLHGIPLYDGDDEARDGKPQAVRDLDQRIRAAHGVIISTPEYNFSVPGVLKNATDWLSRGGSPFKWKRVGVVGAADGPLGTGRAQYHLRQNLQALEAITMPKPELFVGEGSKKFDAEGNLHEADTHKRIAAWLAAFIEWIEKRP